MQRTSGVIAALSGAYASSVIIWQALRLLAGDRWWWLALANTLSLYLFLPLLILLPLAWLSRRRMAITAATVPFVVFLLLYAGLFLPTSVQTKAEDAKVLRVMAFNVLYSNDDGTAIEQLVRAESPDLICLQEVNPRLAVDLATRLGNEYPYQSLLPEESTTGLGLFSRYPLRDEGEIPEPAKEIGWERSVQVAVIEFDGQPTLVLNVHAFPPAWPTFSRYWPPRFELGFWLREEEVRVWLDRVVRHDGPVIVAGDLNSTDQNRAYRLMATQLNDAHRQVGWSLGHTAPSTFEHESGYAVPGRLLRIDFVWYSDHWRAMDAKVGDWDGQSDHLPVFASLVLESE